MVEAQPTRVFMQRRESSDASRIGDIEPVISARKSVLGVGTLQRKRVAFSRA